jgi:hypothetical protein
MQAYVGLLKAEPGKHSIAGKSWLGIAGHLEIAGALSGTGCGSLCSSSDLRQISLHLFGTAGYVFVRAAHVFSVIAFLPDNW